MTPPNWAHGGYLVVGICLGALALFGFMDYQTRARSWNR